MFYSFRVEEFQPIFNGRKSYTFPYTMGRINIDKHLIEMLISSIEPHQGYDYTSQEQTD